MLRRNRILMTILLLMLGGCARKSAWPELMDPPGAAGGGESDAAVIVGIQDYAFIPQVPGAVDNADAWYLYLTKSRKIPAGRVALLVNNTASKEDILRAVKSAASEVEQGGKLWFVFIGHGSPAPGGSDGLLVGYTAQQTANGLLDHSVKQTEILSTLASGKGQVVAVIDACYSGRGTDGAALAPGLQPVEVVDIPEQQGVLLFAAAGSDEYAGPLPGAERPMFSYLLLGALRGWADENEDGEVSAKEAFGYSREVMRAFRATMGRDQTPRVMGPVDMILGRGSEDGPDLPTLVLGQRGVRALANDQSQARRRARISKSEDSRSISSKKAEDPATTTPPNNETLLLEEALRPRYEPIARPKVSPTIRSLALLDGVIRSAERTLEMITTSDKRYPTLLLELASHHADRANAFRRAGKASEAATDDEKAAMLLRRLTTEREFGRFGRMDEALLALAEACERLFRETEMKDTFIRLIQDHPNSPFVPDSYLKFAEYYFSQGKYGDALQLYEKVITFKDSPVYAYALYKMAWSHLNPIGKAEVRYDLSLDFFVKTIQATLEGRTGTGAEAKVLRAAARIDMVKPAAQAARPSKVREFFRKVGTGPGEDEDLSEVQFRELGREYARNNMRAEAEYICHSIRETDRSFRCDWI